MTKVEHTADARVLVGIDISKYRHEVLFAVLGKTRRQHSAVGWKCPVAFEWNVA